MDTAGTDVPADDDEDAYLDKSASAGRMGKAVEYLVAAACILSTRGELNVSTSMVDDEAFAKGFQRVEQGAPCLDEEVTCARPVHCSPSNRAAPAPRRGCVQAQ
jgi:hypothetical protein